MPMNGSWVVADGVVPGYVEQDSVQRVGVRQGVPPQQLRMEGPVCWRSAEPHGARCKGKRPETFELDAHVP